MWCSCSHIATPIYKALVPSLPRRRCHAVSANQHQQVGESGLTLFATHQSNPTPVPKEGEEAQISGSDVLWALQRASAVKKIKNNNKKHIKHDHHHGRGRLSSAAEVVDYTNVRPLCINSNWAAKLDELEKRLHQLSHTI